MGPGVVEWGKLAEIADTLNVCVLVPVLASSINLPSVSLRCHFNLTRESALPNIASSQVRDAWTG